MRLLVFFLAALALYGQTPPQCLVRQAEDFVPMTRTERAAWFENSLAGPTPAVFLAVQAGIGQATDRPREWGQGTEGYSLRFGNAAGQYVLSTIFEHGFALGLHDDNRYFASGRSGLLPRLAYATESTLLARRDNGSRTLSLSAIGGATTGALLASTWQPRSTTSLTDAAVGVGIHFAIRLGMNVTREFAPRLIGRHLK